MSIVIDEEFHVNIIDRTILELFLRLPIHKKKRSDFMLLLFMLQGLAVDTFEINRELLAFLKRLPFGLEFVLRIESKDDKIA